MGVRLGDTVGYLIWCEDCTSQKTAIEYMTDGILLREFMTETDLAGYAAMIIDELHEGTLSTEIFWGLVKFPVECIQSISFILQSLTAQHAIEGVQEVSEETARDLKNKNGVLEICAIYANLLTKMQAKIFQPTAEKAQTVGSATNIAETSNSIKGVAYAIDPGFVKENP
ncbi:hypothetical protein O181_107766 [Austropuccinia psidii MF-1]|uniref:Uncharacterized protein n=1 Tax=Austropuccinia psidii MF-1 TaxID=1389203 RepID=A0A9Q3JTH9_9BASI|nr:hypothetical protein [Austropuccinia psidii MF-1]